MRITTLILSLCLSLVTPSLAQTTQTIVVPPGGITIKFQPATPTPSPTVAPTPTPSPMPTPIPLGGKNCLSTVNGQQWAANCRPYSATSPWNVSLPDSPAQHSVVPSGLLTGAPTSDYIWVGPGNASSDGGYPVYFGTTTDKLWNFICTTYCGTVPKTVYAPANIKLAQGPDHHISLIDRTTGTETDGWSCALSSSTITCAAANQDNFITGSGTENPSTTSGASLGIGLRSDELAKALSTPDGVIPHVLGIVLRCAQSNLVTAPFGTSSATACTSGTSIPIGSQIQYTQTFAQIDALNASNYQKVILRTLHRYGAAVMDTSGYPSLVAGGGFGIVSENVDPYLTNGTPIPWVALLGANGFTLDTVSGSMVGPSYSAADPNFATNFQIVNPCYALGTCTK